MSSNLAARPFPFPPQCYSWPAPHQRCRAVATVLLLDHDGNGFPGNWHCRSCADRIIAEYAEKLGETWTAHAVTLSENNVALTDSTPVQVVSITAGVLHD